MSLSLESTKVASIAIVRRAVACVWTQVRFRDTHPSRSSIGWAMELRSQTNVSGSSAKPRATSLDRGLAADREADDYGVNVTSLVGLPSSPAMTTRDGKLASHTHPVQGGRNRASIPSSCSKSAGSVVGSPEGSPPRRKGKPGNPATWARQLRAIVGLQ